MNKKTKKTVIVGAVVGLVLAGLVAISFMSLKKQAPGADRPVYVQKKASYVASYSENGDVFLYDIQTGKEVSRLQLSNLLSQTTQTKKEGCQTDCQKPQLASWKHFIPFEVEIKQGDTIWDLQKEATPDINPIHMLPLLKEVNKDQSLHPIYPKEKRLLLKKKDPHAVLSFAELKDKEKTENENNQQGDRSFVFFNSPKHHALYAYSPANKLLVRVTEKDGKLDFRSIRTLESSFPSVSELYVSNNYAWLINKERNKVEMHAFSTNEKKEFATEKIDRAIATKEGFLYTTGHTLTKLSPKNVPYTIEMGDRTSDLVEINSHIFALNTFGKNKNTSLLYKIEPKTLKIKKLYKINSADSAIISHGNQQDLYIGKIEKTKKLDGTIKEEPKVIFMDTYKMKGTEVKTDFLFSPHMMSWDRYLYAYQDGKLSLYRAGESKADTSFEIKHETFAIFP